MLHLLYLTATKHSQQLLVLVTGMHGMKGLSVLMSVHWSEMHQKIRWTDE